MTREPPRFPLPLIAHRSLRRPPLPTITDPAFGRFANAVCNARYSSSDSSAWTCPVKTEVSMMTMTRTFSTDHERLYANGVCLSSDIPKTYRRMGAKRKDRWLEYQRSYTLAICSLTVHPWVMSRTLQRSILTPLGYVFSRNLMLIGYPEPKDCLIHTTRNLNPCILACRLSSMESTAGHTS